jgi:hypothetical protein
LPERRACDQTRQPQLIAAGEEHGCCRLEMLEQFRRLPIDAVVHVGLEHLTDVQRFELLFVDPLDAAGLLRRGATDEDARFAAARHLDQTRQDLPRMPVAAIFTAADHQ